MRIWITRAICRACAKITTARSIAPPPRATCAASCCWTPRTFRNRTPCSSPKSAREKHQPPVEPLYTTPDAEKCVQQLVAHDYEKPFQPVPGVTVTFRDAGHILGSAQVILDVQENGRKFRYLFTGDIGRGGDELLRDPIPVENVDYLQIESTYAARVHEQRPDADDTGRPARRRNAEATRQNHHPRVFRRAHAADCLCAARADLRRQTAARARFSWTAR